MTFVMQCTVAGTLSSKIFFFFNFSLEGTVLHESPAYLSLLYRINVNVLYMLNINI